MNRNEFLRGVLIRPKMYSAEIETLRDLLLFVQGVACGLRPPHGARYLSDFGAFVNQKFGKPKDQPWAVTLQEQLGNSLVEEACEFCRQLFEEWTNLQPT